MTHYDRYVAYHIAKAYITAQLDVKHTMALKRITAREVQEGARYDVVLKLRDSTVVVALLPLLTDARCEYVVTVDLKLGAPV